MAHDTAHDPAASSADPIRTDPEGRCHQIDPEDRSQPPMDRLLALMARLRAPESGCPWDLEQDFPTIAPHTIEEAYEVADAIARGDYAELKDELGDLLFQVVFYAQMARERGLYDFDSIATGITEKMLRRHPHVFGDRDRPADGSGMSLRWEDGKAQERARKAATEGRPTSLMDGVILALPALTRAVKLQKRAARVGFDWTEAAPILDKIEEEIGELRAEMTAETLSADRLEDELGDLLFAVANLARRLEIDPEGALRRTNAKFERRFRSIEDGLRRAGRAPKEATLEEMEALWIAAKRAERAA